MWPHQKSRKRASRHGPAVRAIMADLADMDAAAIPFNSHNILAEVTKLIGPVAMIGFLAWRGDLSNKTSTNEDGTPKKMTFGDDRPMSEREWMHHRWYPVPEGGLGDDAAYMDWAFYHLPWIEGVLMILGVMAFFALTLGATFVWLYYFGDTLEEPEGEEGEEGEIDEFAGYDQEEKDMLTIMKSLWNGDDGKSAVKDDAVSSSETQAAESDKKND